MFAARCRCRLREGRHKNAAPEEPRRALSQRRRAAAIAGFCNVAVNGSRSRGVVKTMVLDSYQLLRLAHILLFAYWLGADLGVFLAGGVMSRPGLPVAERNRVRSLLLDIDLAPRIAFIGMLPVGFQLALAWGAPLPAAWLPAVWVAAVAWIGMALVIHFSPGRSFVARLLRLDLWLRVLLLIAFCALAWKEWGNTASPIPFWLTLKFLVIALIVVDGMVLRVYSGQWRLAMDRFAAGDVPGGEALLRIRRRKAASAALVMWGLVALAAFLGAVKPV